MLQSASTELFARFTLGWSHYVTLLSVTDPDARRFYEIEAADNGHTEFLERADALAATTSGAKQTDSTILIREDRGR